MLCRKVFSLSILLYLETKLSRSIAFSPLQGLTVMTGQRVVVQQQGLLTQGTAPESGDSVHPDTILLACFLLHTVLQFGNSQIVNEVFFKIVQTK